MSAFHFGHRVSPFFGRLFVPHRFTKIRLSVLPLSLHSRAVRVNACRGTPILAAKSAKSIHISKMAGVGMRQTRDSQMKKKRSAEVLREEAEMRASLK
ncbi:hypothetical protein [Fibrobacter intestinalis]|uniref:hypothetical protein n=1 Tax=Fibrobacter intestinalis TaxID=28122 RepID=UPI000935460E|nr:hypothetical protein [Fibrobacter intestinalis]